MKINKHTEINGEKVAATSSHIRLERNTPGRAIFTITKPENPPEIGQTINQSAQADGGPWRTLFAGYIERLVPTGTNVWQILARENAAALNQRLNINARHCQPADLLKTISEQTGVVFVMPESDWTKKTAARFQHIGTGYDALDQLIKIWEIPGGIWHQQPDGRVYVGEYNRSVINKTIELPADIFAAKAVTGGTMLLIPRLRPGVKIVTGDITQTITAIEITGDTMRLEWQRLTRKIRATQ